MRLVLLSGLCLAQVNRRYSSPERLDPRQTDGVAGLWLSVRWQPTGWSFCHSSW